MKRVTTLPGYFADMSKVAQVTLTNEVTATNRLYLTNGAVTLSGLVTNAGNGNAALLRPLGDGLIDLLLRG